MNQWNIHPGVLETPTHFPWGIGCSDGFLWFRLDSTLLGSRGGGIRRVSSATMMSCILSKRISNVLSGGAVLV